MLTALSYRASFIHEDHRHKSYSDPSVTKHLLWRRKLDRCAIDGIPINLAEKLKCEVIMISENTIGPLCVVSPLSFYYMNPVAGHNFPGPLAANQC